MRLWNALLILLVFFTTSFQNAGKAAQLHAAQQLKTRKQAEAKKEADKIGARLGFSRAHTPPLTPTPPSLSFQIVNHDTASLPSWGQPSAITGVVNKITGAFALAPTYARHHDLETMLATNHLSVLKEILKPFENKPHEDSHHDDEKAKPLDWQVLYMVRKQVTPTTVKWHVEGIGFIQGPWVKNPGKDSKIPYISLGLPENARSCINHLETAKLKFVEVHLPSLEQLKAVRHIVSGHYPRFLCMSDINVCFAGHAGLCHTSWDTPLVKGSGFPTLPHNFYGFTLIKDKATPGFNLNKTTGSTTTFDPQDPSCKAAAKKMTDLGLNITETAVK